MNNKIRFEVFKRDDFTCQYCGKKPPEATLEVDHIIAKSQGGKDDIQNYLTSCFECNRGKGKHSLKTDVYRKDLSKDLEQLKEKKKQLKAYYKLQEEISNQKAKELDDVYSYWQALWLDKDNFTVVFNDNCKQLKQLLNNFTAIEIKDAFDIAYRKISDQERAYDCFKYACGVLWTIKKGKGYNNVK